VSVGVVNVLFCVMLLSQVCCLMCVVVIVCGVVRVCRCGRCCCVLTGRVYRGVELDVCSVVRPSC